MKPSPRSVTVANAGHWPVVLAVAAIVLATLVAYANSLNGVFIFDDEPAILRNPTIRNLWPLWGPLAPPADATVSGRPVANLSFALNYALGGTQVRGYHVANLLIHVCAGLVLYGVVRRTLAGIPGRAAQAASGAGGDRPPAGRGRDAASLRAIAATQTRANQRSVDAAGNAMPDPSDSVGGAGPWVLPAREATLVAAAAALFWTLHPLQTESVTYIVQRVESLMGLFFLLTFYGFIRSLTALRPGRWRVVAVAACVLGMGTKEVMAAAPVLLLLFDRTFASGSFRRAWAERRGFYLVLAATWLPLAVLVASTGWNRGATVGFDVGVSVWTYWLAQFEAVAHYLRLAVWPYPLVFDYALGASRPPAAFAAAVVLVTALVAATLWALRRRPAAGFLGAWFFLILAPTSVVPSSVQMLVEHRMYLPLAAVAAAVAYGVHRWCGRRGVFVLLALAAGLGWATARRNEVYRSERALWADTVAKCPDNDRARNNLGNVLAREGDLAGAIAQYEAVLRLRPESADTHFNFGNALRRLGRTGEAIAHYERALAANPRMPDARTALGTALEEAGRGDEAVAHYEQALRLDPGYPDAHNRLGIALAKAGRGPEAIAHFEQALRGKPASPEIRGNLGRALVAANRVPEAVEQFRLVVKASPSSAVAHNDLGMVLCMAGRAPESVVHFQEALRLNPNQPRVHLNLAIALEESGRPGEAQIHYEAARRLGAAFPGPGR